MRDKDESWEERRARREAERLEQSIKDALQLLAENGIDVQALADDRDRLTQALDADVQAQEMARLQQGLRDRDARDKFFDLALDRGANLKALDLLWKLAEHQSASDEPDVRALEAALERLSDEADYAFVPESKGWEPETGDAAQSLVQHTEQRAAALPGGPRFIFQDGAWKPTERPHEHDRQERSIRQD